MAGLHQASSQNLKVFISYSRRDVETAEALVRALEAHGGIDALVDRRDLPYGEQWQSELADFIRASDTVVWLVSPDSIASQWCNWELGEVVRLNKRLMPVKIRDVAIDALPQTLGKLHLLPSDGIFSLDRHIDALVDALNADRSWIKEATRLADRARQWLDGQRSRALLLRGEAIRSAEQWKDRQPKTAPAPSREILELILASRRAATQRGRYWFAGSAALMLVGFGLAGLAQWQRAIAVQNEALAVANEKAAQDERLENLKSESRLVSVAAHQLVDENRPALAQAIALEGLPYQPGDRPLVDETVKALKRAIRMDRSLAELTFGKERFYSAAFGSDGSLVTGSRDGTLILWDLQTYQPRWRIDTGNNVDGPQIEISPDNRLVAVAGGLQPGIWDLETGEVKHSFPRLPWGFTGTPRFSPDGNRIALGYNTNFVEIRDTATGALLHRLEGPKDFNAAYERRLNPSQDNIRRLTELGAWSRLGGMTDLAFSPDGRILAVAGMADAEAAARLFDVATGELLATLPGDNLVFSYNRQMAFNRTGTLLAISSRDNAVRVWNVKERKLKFALRHTAESHAISFDPTGAFLAAGYADGSVRVWSTEDGQPVATFTAHTDRVTSIKFTADGSAFTTSSFDRTVALWWNTLDPEACSPEDRAMFCDASLRSAAVLRGHNDKVNLAVFDPDGKHVVSIADDATLRVWRTGISGHVTLALPPKVPVANDMTDEEIEDLKAAIDDPNGRIANLPEGELRELAMGHGLKEEVKTLDVIALRKKLQYVMKGILDERQATRKFVRDFRAKMHEIAKHHRREQHLYARQREQAVGISIPLPDGSDPVHRLAFTNDGEQLIATEDVSTFTLWDVSAAKPVCQTEGRRLTVGADGALRVYYGVFDSKPVQCPAQEDNVIRSGGPSSAWIMSPDGTRAVAAREWLNIGTNAPDKSDIVLIDVEKKSAIATLTAEGREPKAFQLSADGAIIVAALAGDRDKKIEEGSQYAVWDAATGTLIGTTPLSNKALNHVGIAARGRQFVLAENGAPHVTHYHVDERGQLASQRIAGPQRGVTALALSADGAAVAVAYQDGSILLFATNDGRQTATLPPGNNPVRRLAFSPDGQLLAGSDSNNIVRLWDVTTRAPMVSTPVNSEPIALKFSPTNDRLAVRTKNGGLHVLAVDLDLGLERPDDLADWARASLSAALSDSDRQRFLLKRHGGRDADRSLLAFAQAAHTERGAAANDPAALRRQAEETALSGGLAGAAKAMTLAFAAADGKAANALFQLALDIDRVDASADRRELAFFYLQLGQRLAEASPAGSVDQDLWGAAAERLKTLPRQLSPATLVKVFRQAREWRVD